MAMVREVERLWRLGFALLWIHPRNKRPIESGWTKGPRSSLEYLRKTYRPSNNLGVRTGSASKIGENFLAVIDVDIKDPRFNAKAQQKIKELTRGVKCPMVMSGSGTGSRHYYCVTKKPFKMITVLKEAGGEVCIYSDGRQMVLPPSVTKNAYRWVRVIETADDLPLLDFEKTSTTETTAAEKGVNVGSEKPVSRPAFKDFKIVDVELDFVNIDDSVRRKIESCEGLTDRSAYLKTACEALLSSGLKRNEILSLLTDRRYSLAHAALERRQNRMKAAEWIYQYCLEPMVEKRRPSNMLEVAELPTKRLSGDALKKQNDRIREKNEKNWEDRLIRNGRNGEGGIKPCITNMIKILRKGIGEEIFKHDLFAQRTAYGLKMPWGSKKGRVINDAEVAKIKYWVSRNFKFDPSNNLIEDAILVIAHENAYDPVRDWLDDLPEWDKNPRLATWLEKYFEAEGMPEYLDQVFTKWLVSMVARVYQPGAKFDWMPIFEGAQGIGKSSFGRILVGDNFFLDWLPNLADKDAAVNLQGSWLVEMGELASFRKNEIETIKAFITRTIDKYRPPFGRRLEEMPRRCVFFGTTNRETYLRDDTGNRRFKPVKVGSLDFAQLAKDRDQLFAEAKWKFNHEMRNIWDLELTGKAKKFEQKMHLEKMVEDDSDAMLLAMTDFLEKVAKNEAVFEHRRFKILSLFEGVGCLGKWRPEMRNVIFATKMIKKLGGQKIRINGAPFWRLPEKSDFYDLPSTQAFHSENDF